MNKLLSCLFVVFIAAFSLGQFDTSINESPLNAAVRANNLKEVKRLVDAGEPINLDDNFETEALDIAIEKDFREIALFLLLKGATSRNNFYSAVSTGDINWIKTLLSYNFYDSEAIIPAIESGNLALVKLLISEGFPVDFEQKRRTGLFRKHYVSPLDVAFNVRSDEMVFELVKAGAPIKDAFYDAAQLEHNELGKKLIDLNKQLNDLLLLCAETGNLTLLNYCIANGADKNSKDLQGRNILLLAAQYGKSEIYTHSLIKLGLSPNSVTTQNENALMLSCRSNNAVLITELLNANQNLEFQNTVGETVLFYADRCEISGIFELVLAKNPMIEHKDNDGNTVLLKAAKGQRSSHVNLLIDKGANINVKNNAGENLISCLINDYAKNEGLILDLMNKGVDPNVKSTDGKDFAFIAIETGKLELLKSLHSKGISVDGRNNYNQRPSTKNLEIIRYVIENGGDPNARDSWSNTYLCTALELNDLEFATFLVKHKADINIPSCFMDEFLLFEAITKNNLPFVQFLVESKANLYIKSRWSKNAMELAIEKNNPEIIAYLRSKGAMTKDELNKREVERAKEMQTLPTLIEGKNIQGVLQLLNKYPEIILSQDETKKIALLCAETGSIDLLQKCLEQLNWELNAPVNFEQQTILHIATKNNLKDFLVLVVNKGGNPYIEDAFGKLPSDYAKSKETKDFYKHLKAKKKEN